MLKQAAVERVRLKQMKAGGKGICAEKAEWA